MSAGKSTGLEDYTTALAILQGALDLTTSVMVYANIAAEESGSADDHAAYMVAFVVYNWALADLICCQYDIDRFRGEQHGQTDRQQ